jgi:hypothetical protein
VIPVSNTTVNAGATFLYLINRVNELATYMSTATVTTDANASTTNTNGSATITGTMTANAFVVGNSTVNAVVNSTSIAIRNAASNVTITVPSASAVGNSYAFFANGTWNFIPVTTAVKANLAGNTAKLVDSYAIADYMGAEYVVSIRDNAANNLYISRVLTTHDTTLASITEYASITSNSSVGVITANSNSTHVRLYFEPVGTATNTTIRYTRTVV